jgi:hypothetical protein
VSDVYTVTEAQIASLQSVIGERLSGVPFGRLNGALYFKLFYALVAYFRDRLERSMLLCTADVETLGCIWPFLKVGLGFPVDIGALTNGFSSVRLGGSGGKLAASIRHEHQLDLQIAEIGGTLLVGDAIPHAGGHNDAADVNAFVAMHAEAASVTRKLWDAIPCAVVLERGRVTARAEHIYGGRALAVIPCGATVGLEPRRLALVQKEDGRWELRGSLQHPEASIAFARDESYPAASAGWTDHMMAVIAAAFGVAAPKRRCQNFTRWSQPLPFRNSSNFKDDMVTMRAYEQGVLGGGSVIPASEYSAYALEYARLNLTAYVDNGRRSLAFMVLSRWGESVRACVRARVARCIEGLCLDGRAYVCMRACACSIQNLCVVRVCVSAGDGCVCINTRLCVSRSTSGSASAGRCGGGQCGAGRGAEPRRPGGPVRRARDRRYGPQDHPHAAQRGARRGRNRGRHAGGGTRATGGR